MGAFDVFPLPADANYNYAQAFDRRAGGHHGTDIFAPRGTPVLAVFDGDARADDDPKGGNVVYLQATGPFGRTAYYAHLDSVEPPLGLGKVQFVNAGDVIGYVGTTGNAANTPPHLHLQVTPPSGRGVDDPFPHLVEVDTKRGGAPADPNNPPSPPTVDVDEQTGAITVDDDLLLYGGAALAALLLWWLWSSNAKQSRRAA